MEKKKMYQKAKARFLLEVNCIDIEIEATELSHLTASGLTGLIVASEAQKKADAHNEQETPAGPSSINAVSTKPVFKHFPKRSFGAFNIAPNFDGHLKKVDAFNKKLFSDQNQRPLALAEMETARLACIVKILEDAPPDHSSKFADSDIALLLKVLRSWPVSMISPVIDIVRILILHPDGAAKFLNSADGALLEMVKNITVNPVNSANIITTLCLLTNLFKSRCFHPWLQSHLMEILDAFSRCQTLTSVDKNVQRAFSALILNYAVLLNKMSDEEGQPLVLYAALEIAEAETFDANSKFCALVAIGSLMVDGAIMKKEAMEFGVEDTAKIAKASKEANLAEVGADIELLLKQS